MNLKYGLFALGAVCLPLAAPAAFFPMSVIPTTQDNFRIDSMSVAARNLLFVPAGLNRTWFLFRESGSWQATSNNVPTDCFLATLEGLSMTDKVHYLTTNGSRLVLGRLQEVASNSWSIQTNTHLPAPAGKAIVSTLAVSPLRDAAVVRTLSPEQLFLLRSNLPPVDLGPFALVAWSTNGILLTRQQASGIEAFLHSPADGTLIRTVNLPLPTSLALYRMSPDGIWTDENGTVYRRSSSLLSNDVTLELSLATNRLSLLKILEDGGVLIQNGASLQRFDSRGGRVFSVSSTNSVLTGLDLDSRDALSPDGQYLLMLNGILFAASGVPAFRFSFPAHFFENEQPNQGFSFFQEGTRMFLARANFFSDDVFIREVPLMKLTARPLGTNQLRLDWPATDFPFQLRQATNAAGPFAQTITNQLVSNGVVNVTLSTTGSQAYFKLQMD
jgi:hypothetical protein